MAKNILNMILWHPEMNIENCNITYIHRGAPGNLKKVGCGQISRLNRGFLIMKDETEIPCHRIIKIEYNSQVLWKK